MQKLFKSPIFWVVGAAVGIYALTRLSLSNKTTFYLKNIRPGGTFLQPEVLIELAIQNPTSQKTVLKSLTGSVTVNDKFLANVSAFGDQVIQPNSENTVILKARPSALGIFQTLKQLFTTPTGQNVIAFTGTANVDGFTIPINESQNV